jgi:hypothetical protein
LEGGGGEGGEEDVGLGAEIGGGGEGQGLDVGVEERESFI